jgi:hypothetical protein
MIELRRTVHLAVLAGLSACGYAGFLAFVTMLQASTDAAAIGERAPLHALTDTIASSHDRLEASVIAASSRYGQMTDRYDALLPQIIQLEASLDTLAKTTSNVTDSTLRLPSRVSLPALPATRVVRIAPPTAHGVTGASGR